MYGLSHRGSLSCNMWLLTRDAWTPSAHRMEIKEGKSWGWMAEIFFKKSSVSRFIFRSTEVENKCSDYETRITRPAFGLWEQPGSYAVKTYHS